MAINFKSVGHFFAKAYTAIVAAIPKVEADIVKVEGTAAVVEKVTSAIPTYGPLAVTLEQAGYAVLGELASVLTAGGSAAEAKLSDAGLDTNVISTVKALVAGFP
jgi:hypothetical protein